MFIRIAEYDLTLGEMEIVLMAKIKVMVIDDSMVFREFLSRSLLRDSDIEIVGKFGDPVEAMDNIERLRPTVMTVDMEMPKMRGDEFLKQVLPKYPSIKAVVISALSGNVFDAMHAGAIEFIGKPGSQPGYTNEQFAAEIVQKVKIAATATARSAAPSRPARRPVTSVPTPLQRFSLSAATSKSIIAIGASTGGTEAIIEVVRHFPANTPGVVIVQHMPPVFTKMYADRVNRLCKMKVKEAANGDRVEQGIMLIAPGGDEQMRVRRDAKGYYVSLTKGPKVSGHCPSVDVLFESVAQAAGRDAVGVLLTGMGADGAENLALMKRSGAHTIGQDEESCVVYGMPKVAFEKGGVSEQLPLSSIGEAVLRKLSRP